jgi:hypothetical protein
MNLQKLDCLRYLFYDSVPTAEAMAYNSGKLCERFRRFLDGNQYSLLHMNIDVFVCGAS